MKGWEAMPAYRIYRLDLAGKIEAAEWIAADDDEQVMALARAQVGPCEVWDRGRCVGRVENKRRRE
jgi:hypothetical protein